MSSLTLLRETQDLGSALNRKDNFWSVSAQRGLKPWILYSSPGISLPRHVLCEMCESG